MDFVFLLPISMIAPKAIAPLFVITILVSVITNICRGDIDWRIGQTAVITGMAIAIALCSVGWSSTPLESFRTWIAFAATLAGGNYLISHASLQPLKKCPPAADVTLYGGALGFIIISLDLFWGVSGTTYLLNTFSNHFQSGTNDARSLLNSSMSIASIIIWPWLILVYRKIGWKIIIVIAFVAIGVFAPSESSAPKLAFVIGLIVLFISLLSIRVVPNIIALATVVLVLFSPIIAASLPDPTKPDNKVEFISNSGTQVIDLEEYGRVNL